MTGAPPNVVMVAAALADLRLESDLKDIYAAVAKANPEWRKQYKNEESFLGTIRHTLESYCPQSENYRPDRPAFFEKTATGRYRLVPPAEREDVISRGRSL